MGKSVLDRFRTPEISASPPDSELEAPTLVTLRAVRAHARPKFTTDPRSGRRAGGSTPKPRRADLRDARTHSAPQSLQRWISGGRSGAARRPERGSFGVSRQDGRSGLGHTVLPRQRAECCEDIGLVPSRSAGPARGLHSRPRRPGRWHTACRAKPRAPPSGAAQSEGGLAPGRASGRSHRWNPSGCPELTPKPVPKSDACPALPVAASGHTQRVGNLRGCEECVTASRRQVCSQ